MLALTDAAFARLVRGAREVPRRARGRWLRDVAAKLDPPRSIIRSRERSRRKRDAPGSRAGRGTQGTAKNGRALLFVEKSAVARATTPTRTGMGHG
jgi:hypothetical protein